MKLHLNYDESKELLATGIIIIERNGKNIVIEENDMYSGGYSINIINYYDEVVFETESD